MDKITEGNKLIAEFLGYKFYTAWYSDDPCCEGCQIDKLNPRYNEGANGNIFVPLDEMLYHKSYDWLMPVVEKIDSLGFEVHIHSTGGKLYSSKRYFAKHSAV